MQSNFVTLDYLRIEWRHKLRSLLPNGCVRLFG